MNVDLTPTWVVTAMIVKKGNSTMAKIETKHLFSLTNDERTWLSFANLALAEVSNMMDDYDCLLNMETGEIMEQTDINKAFSVIEYLLEGNLEIVEEDSSPYGYDFENER